MRRFPLQTAILAALSVALAWAPPPVEASTFVAMSTSELVKSSSAVIEAEVYVLESRWTADRRIIVTDATLRVWNVLGGQAGPTSYRSRRSAAP